MPDQKCNFIYDSMTLGNNFGHSEKTEWEKTRKDKKKLVFRANAIARGEDAMVPLTLTPNCADTCW